MKPVSVRGRCFKRSGSVTRQMMSAEIAEVHLQCTGQSPDARTIDGKTVEDLIEGNALYWNSLEKLGRMRKRLAEHGFTSFAEA